MKRLVKLPSEAAILSYWLRMIRTLNPMQLRSSWPLDDKRPRMARSRSIDADIDIFFCDPHAPWRATNENTVSVGGGLEAGSGRLVPAA
jgi:IS30 family transposase